VIECSVWWATPLPAEAHWLGLLDEPELGRYSAFRRPIDQRRFLTGRVLAKTLVGDRLGLAPGSVSFDATCADCGKPHGPPRIDGVGLSISHSGERVGVALTGGAAVGLDVETATRRAEDSLIRYALNPVELATLDGLSAQERADAFFVYWTRKEALMKATGRGLRISLESLTLSGHDAAPRLVASTSAELAPDTARLADLDAGEGYRAAVAVLGSEDLTVTERWARLGP
jgi:4'-phosphopantetheinyl transferase